MAARIYTQAKLNLLDGAVQWTIDDIYAMLVSSAYTYSAAHTTRADVSTHEITDTDYDPKAIGGRGINLGSGTIVEFNCNDISFGSSVTIDASGGHLIILKGNALSPASGDPLLFELQLPDPASSTNGIFTVTTPSGVWNID